jgi:hypothetical protein
MFQNPRFRKINFEEVPLNQDLIIMDEKWASGRENEWLKIFNKEEANPYSIGYVSFVAARSIGDDWIELSWYPNIFDRFHEIPIFLPKSVFVTCIDISDYDEKPTIFVKSEWVEDLHTRPLAAFAIIDAIGVKEQLQSGALRPNSLRTLRELVDLTAANYPNLAFISFADSLLIKQSWSVGYADKKIKYSYSPELLLPAIKELQNSFQTALNLPSYAVMTQGLNAYEDSQTLHISPSGNHISLNTLGLPFAQLMAIESSARHAIKNQKHAREELYIDSMLFRSLDFKPGTDKKKFNLYPYTSPMTKSQNSYYTASSYQEIFEQLN